MLAGLVFVAGIASGADVAIRPVSPEDVKEILAGKGDDGCYSTLQACAFLKKA